MAEKTQQYTADNANFDFEDHELRETMREYLQDENKNSSNIWNFSTIAGLVMIFIAMSFMAQLVISNTLGISLGSDFSYILNVLPVIGGVLLVLVGFGLVSSERRKKKKNIQMGKSETGSRSSSSSSDSETYSQSDRQAATESSHTRNRDRLDDFLYSDYSRQKKKKKYSSERVDSYAMQQNKKLFRSRTDKKWAGVCGGLAKYFGISPTAVRLVFVLATLLGYGSFILVYIAMGIVVPKEPIDRMELSDF